ncbi:CBO0543 family protein [Evansella clarkii]|uniref:CBO0543 family protein n=1 Tax=Evansella clarkii TaxID=79879 RepID=UPI000996D086|nr:CBO0543 family protein [Evansella clarkii]
MREDRGKYFNELVSMQKKLTEEGIAYWQLYSDFSSWQFWVCLLILLGPLIVVYFTIDREKIYLISFYGFAVHVLFAYTDQIGIRLGLWGYPYQVLPFIPSVSLDAALIPVAVMLVYQWTINNNKSFYLYAFITALIFGFGFKPILVINGLFERFQWVNYFHIFLIYIVLFLAAYFLTKLFAWMQKQTKENSPIGKP